MTSPVKSATEVQKASEMSVLSSIPGAGVVVFQGSTAIRRTEASRLESSQPP